MALAAAVAGILIPGLGTSTCLRQDEKIKTQGNLILVFGPLLSQHQGQENIGSSRRGAVVNESD